MYKIVVDETTIPQGYKLSDKNVYTFKLDGKNQALILDFIKVPAKTNTPDVSASADTNNNSNKDSNKVQDNLAPNYITNIYVQTSELKNAPSDTSQANKESAQVRENKQLEKGSVKEKAEAPKTKGAEEISSSVRTSALPKTADIANSYTIAIGVSSLACLALAYIIRKVRVF